jgi:hypothetical protein
MNQERNGGVSIDRDDNGRSDIQPEVQGSVPAAAPVGGVSPADLDQAGGSSGTGGYGHGENQQHHQGTGDRSPSGTEPDAGGEARGERFDEVQGGGR